MRLNPCGCFIHTPEIEEFGKQPPTRARAASVHDVSAVHDSYHVLVRGKAAVRMTIPVYECVYVYVYEYGGMLGRQPDLNGIR